MTCLTPFVLSHRATVVARAALLAAICAVAAACGDSTVTAAAPSAPVALTISPSAIRLGVGQIAALHAAISSPDASEALRVMLEWHSSDPTVAFVDPHGPNLTTTLRAMREGVVNITASVPGSQAAVTVYVTAQPPSMGRLEVVDFRMVQFQYPSSTRWDYAPLMRVREASGKGAVYVISVDFDIPGAEAVGPIPWLRTLNAGTTYDFFAMFYGDFDLTLGSSTVPLAGTMARARITTTDSLEAPLVVTVTGPVVTN